MGKAAAARAGIHSRCSYKGRIRAETRSRTRRQVILRPGGKAACVKLNQANNSDLRNHSDTTLAVRWARAESDPRRIGCVSGFSGSWLYSFPNGDLVFANRFKWMIL